jgi:dipeptidyl aminopeptidase/acylaminoacyl peptidase
VHRDARRHVQPESAFGTTEELWFNEWEFKGKPDGTDYGKPDAENPFRKWSPMLAAKNFKTPTLVIHGQLDYRLDVSEGFQLFTALQLLGCPARCSTSRTRATGC